jgi:sporulation protein YqfC
MPHRLVNGAMSAMEVPSTDLVSIVDSTIKGNSDGITDRMQSFTPSKAPSIAVAASRMSRSIPVAVSRVVPIFAVDFTHITSEDSMSRAENNHCSHIEFHKGGAAMKQRRNAAFSPTPLVEIAGEKRVLIEHHAGVTQYDPCRICVKVSFGQICVCGQNLSFAQIARGQLVICGKIEGVTLLRRGG